MPRANARIEDVGPKSQAFDIERAANQNHDYRSVAWSGKYLQVTLMSIPVGATSAWKHIPIPINFSVSKLAMVMSRWAARKTS